MGRDVREGGAPPGQQGTFVLLVDLRDEAQATEVLDWVQGGGTLLLADPDSILLDALGVVPSEDVPSGRLRPGCAVREVRGVAAVEAHGRAGLTSVDPRGIGCFARNGAALVVARDVGRGRAVVLGDPSALSNELLGNSDNAIFALQAISKGPVVFGAPVPAGAAAPRQGLWASLPLVARVCLAELALALMVFAAVRARRLGRPVPEAPLVPIPSGELVKATGRLLRIARATGYAGRELRRAMIGRLSRRAGAPAASGEELAALLARAGAGAEPDLVRVLAGPEPRTDAELIALGREIERLRRRVEHVETGDGPKEEGRA